MGATVKVDPAALEPDITESFITAGGPGGQNVNKVSTAVQLRFDLEASTAFSAAQKVRLRAKLANRINSEGEIVLQAQSQRSQGRNREEARERLVELLEKALETRKYRVPTRPTRAAKERRLKSKTRRGQVKAKRGKVRPGNE